MTSSPITVISWNIQFGIAVDAAINALTSTTHLRGADVVLLQEMDSAGAARIAAALDMDHYFEAACTHPKSGREFGNAVLSRGPISNHRVVDLPHQSRWQGTPRIAVGADTMLRGTPVGLWSVHTEVPTLGARKRRAQFQRTAEAAAEHSPGCYLVGGDFNTPTARSIARLSDSMRHLGARHISETSGHSLVRARRRLTLDHLFAQGLVESRCGTVEVPGASDHRALWAEVRLSEPGDASGSG